MSRIPVYTAKRCTAVEGVGTALAWRFGGVKFIGSSMLLCRVADCYPLWLERGIESGEEFNSGT